MKNILIIFVFFFLCACGYTSVIKNQKSNDVMISIISSQGDNEMNNLIKNQLNIISDTKSLNIFTISFISNYEKIVITKNSAGIATDYKLNTNVEFDISKNGIMKKIKLNESFNIKNDTENFEQENYESTIKRNFALSIRNKLIPYLLNFDDN